MRTRLHIRLFVIACLAVFSNVAFSQVFTPTHAGALINGNGAVLSNPSCVFVSGNYAYVTSASNALEIIDITNPVSPVHRSSLSDGAGGAVLNNPMAVFVSGNYAYVASYGSSALEVIDVTNPFIPVHKSKLVNGTGGAMLLNPNSIFISGNYAYIASYNSDALEIVDITNPAAPVHKGSLSNGTGGALLDAPFSVTVSGSFAYVANNSGSLEVIDVSNPGLPAHVGSIANGAGGSVLAGATSVSVSGGYAYVASPSQNSLEVIDVSTPASPTHAATLSSGVTGAQSVVASGNFAYLACKAGNEFVVVNVSTPAAPSIVGTLTSGTGGAALTGANFVIISGSNAFVSASGSNAMEVVDISAPASPSHKGKLSDGDGLVTTLQAPNCVVVKGNYAYITSQGSDALEIVDIFDPAAPAHKGSLSNGGSALLTDPKSVFVAGNYAYIASYGSNALEIVDITNPASPVHKSSLQNGSGGAQLLQPLSVFVSGNYAYVASFGSGALEVVDVSNPAVPFHVGSLSASPTVKLTNPTSVFVSGNYAYVTNIVNDALEVVDISNPALPTHVTAVTTQNSGAIISAASCVYVADKYAYITNAHDLEILDVSDPTSPQHRGNIACCGGGALLDNPLSVYTIGNHAYVASATSAALEIVNISNPVLPLHTASITDGSGGAQLAGATAVAVSGNYAFVTSAIDNALEVVSLYTSLNSMATNIQFTAASPTSLTATFTVGTGKSRIVVVSQGSPIAASPVNGTTYAASASYGAGAALGTGRVVSNGKDNVVTVTNLSPSTVYYFQVFEYNGSPGSEVYNTATGTGNPASHSTPTNSPPTVQASALQFTGIGTTSMTVSFANGNGSSRLLLANANTSVTSDPVGGTTYTANQNFGTGPKIGASYIVGAGSGPFTVTNLTAGTDYYYRVYEFSGAAGTESYNLTTASGNPAHTPALSLAPTGLFADVIETTNFGAFWSASAGATSYLLDVSTDNFATFVPGYHDRAALTSGASVSGLDGGTNYQFRVRAVNASGPSAYSATGTTITLPETPVALAASDFTNTSFIAHWSSVKGAANYSVTYSNSEDFVGSDVIEVDGETSSHVTIDGLSPGTVYYYKVKATNASGSTQDSNVITASTLITTNIPTLTSGGTLADYGMISIPLVLDSTIATIFQSLGTPGNKNWRLLTWQGDKFLEYGLSGGPTTIERGRSYWFNSINQPNISVTGYVFTGSSFKLPLKQGWNQVASPYNFDVSWTDVLSKNPAATGVESSIYRFDGAGHFSTSDNLRAWGGAYVFNSGTAVDIVIPKDVAHATGGRVGEPQPERMAGGWLTPLTISNGIVRNELPAIGMRPDALTGYDKHDAVSLPRFLDYIDMSTYHAEFFSPWFTKDVVPLADNYTWTYEVETNSPEHSAQLTWDNSGLASTDAQMLLYDPLNHVVLDMKERNQYSFSIQAGQRIKFIYGKDKASLRPDITDLGNPYPNPASDNVILPLLSSEDGIDADLEISDMMGRPVGQMSLRGLTPGLHQLVWDLADPAGNKAPAGLYLCRIKGSSSVVHVAKLIIK